LNSSSAKCPSLRGPNFTTPFRPADGSRGESALGQEEPFQARTPSDRVGSKADLTALHSCGQARKACSKFYFDILTVCGHLRLLAAAKRRSNCL
jgi:hypothetical protein